MEEVINKITTDINNAMSIIYHYDISSYFNNVSSNKDEIYEDLLNYYLSKIKELGNVELNHGNDMDKLGEYFDFFGSSPKKDNYRQLDTESSDVVTSLISKLVTTNHNRQLKLPITLNIIKDYFISSNIVEDDINIVVESIIVDLAVIYEYFSKKKNST